MTVPHPKLNRLSKSHALIAVVCFAAAGLLLTTLTRAVTSGRSAEAENGVIAGNATSMNSAGASGSGKNSVLFGVQAATATDVTTLGAACNGGDDTSSLQAIFDQATAGQTLRVPAGKTCRHDGVLYVRKAGLHLIGPGTLQATDPQASSLLIVAPNVVIEGGLTLRVSNSGERLDAPEQAGIAFDVSRGNASGAILRNITIDGSAAAGIYNVGATDFIFDGVTVENTLADCIHNTGGANNGTIRNSVSRNCGDDGVAVVSYKDSGKICHDITIDSPKFYNQTHGRAFSVVGGQNITFKNVYAEDSDAAAIYIGSEPSYDTYGVSDIKILGGTLLRSNKNSSTDHGAILIYNGNSGTSNSRISIQDITIKDTRLTASRQVGIVGNQPSDHLELSRLNITGGPSDLFQSDAPDSSYNTIGWTFNGSPITDHKGF